jgi:hypothetical protein
VSCQSAAVPMRLGLRERVNTKCRCVGNGSFGRPVWRELKAGRIDTITSLPNRPSIPTDMPMQESHRSPTPADWNSMARPTRQLIGNTLCDPVRSPAKFLMGNTCRLKQKICFGPLPCTRPAISCDTDWIGLFCETEQTVASGLGTDFDLLQDPIIYRPISLKTLKAQPGYGNDQRISQS